MDLRILPIISWILTLIAVIINNGRHIELTANLEAGNSLSRVEWSMGAGTGKTLLARAVANRTDACFIRVIGSELVQKYVGEGARMVRELFQMARSKKACLIFFDEVLPFPPCAPPCIRTTPCHAPPYPWSFDLVRWDLR